MKNQIARGAYELSDTQGFLYSDFNHVRREAHPRKRIGVQIPTNGGLECGTQFGGGSGVTNLISLKERTVVTGEAKSKIGCARESGETDLHNIRVNVLKR